MAKARLTTNAVAALKPQTGRLEVFDSVCPGLSIRVGEDTKSWVVRYRTLDGRQPRMTLGSFPAVGVAEARDLAAQVKRQARAGEDPGSERKRAKERLAAQTIRTFDDLADAYLAACARGEWKPKGKLKRQRTLSDELNILRRNVRPVIGSMRLEEITRGSIKALLRRMVDRGVHAQTNRTQAVIRQCFAFGINEDETGQRLTVNPATGFAPLGNEAPRRSTYDDDALRRLWIAVEAPEAIEPVNGKPLKLSRQMADRFRPGIIASRRQPADTN